MIATNICIPEPGIRMGYITMQTFLACRMHRTALYRFVWINTGLKTLYVRRIEKKVARASHDFNWKKTTHFSASFNSFNHISKSLALAYIWKKLTYHLLASNHYSHSKLNLFVSNFMSSSFGCSKWTDDRMRSHRLRSSHRCWSRRTICTTHSKNEQLCSASDIQIPLSFLMLIAIMC